MAVAGPIHIELLPDSVEPGLYGKPTTPSIDRWRSGYNELREWASNQQATEVKLDDDVSTMA